MDKKKGFLQNRHSQKVIPIKYKKRDDAQSLAFDKTKLAILKKEFKISQK